MSIPVVMFNVLGYDINPAFLLVPLISVAFLVTFNIVGVLYLLSVSCGVASIFIVNKISPDGDAVRHAFSLILIMFAPSFLFLGNMLGRRVAISRIFFWLSVFSSIFVFVVAFRVLYLDQDVRIYVGPLEYAYMNAEFLGAPVFATFGVLSLADLICLQTIMICGSFVGGNHRLPVMLGFGVSLFCGAFLITGSDSRSAQVLLVWILGTAIVYAFKNRTSAIRSIVAILLIVLATGFCYTRMTESRMLNSLAHIDRGADEFATGRIELAIEAFREIVASPFIGNGFSGYGRYLSDEGGSKALSMNSSTHIYYLTLIWKGGLLFFVPFALMLLINLKACWLARKKTDATPERFYAWSAVLMAFGPMAMAWDILIVPSAGALAFLLFGMLAACRKA